MQILKKISFLNKKEAEIKVKAPEYPVNVKKDEPTNTTPTWLTHAKRYIGTKEIKGQINNVVIVNWWEKIKLSIRDDETPWCAAFVGAMLEECGIKSTRSAAARSYLKWGTEITKPTTGCVVVFWRGSPTGWSGHVGFLVGQDKMGNLMILGGNQSDEVNIKPFSKKRVLSYRVPNGYVVPNTQLALVSSDGKLSENEA